MLFIYNNFAAKWKNLRIRLNNGISSETNEGRVEVTLDNGLNWGTLCSTNWSLREGNVVCQHLGLGYASQAQQDTKYGNSKTNPWSMVGTECRGNEQKLQNCQREKIYPQICNATNMKIARVKCSQRLPDLSIAVKEMESGYLESVPLHAIQCALEEKCVSRDAYAINRVNRNAERLLLRFRTAAENVGTADFSPYANFNEWQWHQCHRHYHSMETFAEFNVYDLKYKKVAEGHKASFCLMDSKCQPGFRQKYSCENRTQGISVGCSDVYDSQLDCQWVDVTLLPKNHHYILRVALNPQYLIGEISFDNNGAECLVNYTGDPRTTKIYGCKSAPLWLPNDL